MPPHIGPRREYGNFTTVGQNNQAFRLDYQFIAPDNGFDQRSFTLDGSGPVSEAITRLLFRQELNKTTLLSTENYPGIPQGAGQEVAHVFPFPAGGQG